LAIKYNAPSQPAHLSMAYGRYRGRINWSMIVIHICYYIHNIDIDLSFDSNTQFHTQLVSKMLSILNTSTNNPYQTRSLLLTDRPCSFLPLALFLSFSTLLRICSKHSNNIPNKGSQRMS
jgi:hypothetical protein